MLRAVGIIFLFLFFSRGKAHVPTVNTPLLHQLAVGMPTNIKGN